MPTYLDMPRTNTYPPSPPHLQRFLLYKGKVRRPIVHLFPFTPFVSTSLKQHLFFPRDNQVKPFHFSIQKHVLPRENPHRNEQMEWPAYLIVIILSPVLSFCLSISMCAPVHSRIALMLHPPLPMTLDITVDGTETFLDLYKKKQH